MDRAVGRCGRLCGSEHPAPCRRGGRPRPTSWWSASANTPTRKSRPAATRRPTPGRSTTYSPTKYLGAAGGDARLLLGQEGRQMHANPPRRRTSSRQSRASREGAKGRPGRHRLDRPGGTDRRPHLLPGERQHVQGPRQERSHAGEIEALVEKAKTEKLCAIVDVNFQGLRPITSFQTPTSRHVQRLHRQGGQGRARLPPGRVVMLSNSSQTRVVDLEARPVHQGAARRPQGRRRQGGYEPDGVVTVDEFDTYSTRSAEAGAQARQDERREGTGRLSILAHESNHFVLTNNPAALPKVEERLEKLDRRQTGSRRSPRRARSCWPACRS